MSPCLPGTTLVRREPPGRATVRCLAIFSVVLFTGCVHDTIRLSASPAHPQDVSGHWVVDPSRSEDPDALAAVGGDDHAMGGGHGHGGGGGGMGGGGMGGGGGHHGGGAHGDTGVTGHTENGGNLRRAQLLPDQLDIVLQPANLILTPDGHARTIPMVTAQDTVADVTRAGWDGDSLVVIIHVGDKRADIVQRYVVAPDHTRLVVTTEFKGKSKTVSVIREFTAAAAPASAASPAPQGRPVSP